VHGNLRFSLNITPVLLPKMRSVLSVTLTVISSIRFRQHDMILLANYLEDLSHYPTLLRDVLIATQNYAGW
jgi:hypothetical protein